MATLSTMWYAALFNSLSSYCPLCRTELDPSGECSVCESDDDEPEFPIEWP